MSQESSEIVLQNACVKAADICFCSDHQSGVVELEIVTATKSFTLTHELDGAVVGTFLKLLGVTKWSEVVRQALRVKISPSGKVVGLVHFLSDYWIFVEDSKFVADSENSGSVTQAPEPETPRAPVSRETISATQLRKVKDDLIRWARLDGISPNTRLGGSFTKVNLYRSEVSPNLSHVALVPVVSLLKSSENPDDWVDFILGFIEGDAGSFGTTERLWTYELHFCYDDRVILTMQVTVRPQLARGRKPDPKVGDKDHSLSSSVGADSPRTEDVVMVGTECFCQPTLRAEDEALP